MSEEVLTPESVDALEQIKYGVMHSTADLFNGTFALEQATATLQEVLNALIKKHALLTRNYNGPGEIVDGEYEAV